MVCHCGRLVYFRFVLCVVVRQRARELCCLPGGPGWLVTFVDAATAVCDHSGDQGIQHPGPAATPLISNLLWSWRVHDVARVIHDLRWEGAPVPPWQRVGGHRLQDLELWSNPPHHRHGESVSRKAHSGGLGFR